MSAIKKELRQRQIVTVDFSAWRYEKEEHLIIPLLDTIREALVEWSERLKAFRNNASATLKEKRNRYSDAALKTAKTMGKVMASLTAGISFKLGLPDALEFSYDASKALSKAKELKSENSKNKGSENFSKKRSDPNLYQSLYHLSFNALKECFEIFQKETGGARIVIFIDDLDRCMPKNAVEVLESMKLFFDLRGFIFVVGLDRVVVERCIDHRYESSINDNIIKHNINDGEKKLISGSSYLKKIFQVPYSLAPISLDQIDPLIDSLCRDSKLPEIQKIDLHKNVRHHLTYLVTGWSINPREVKRYINAYTLQLKIKSNLNPEAVLSLQTINFRQDWEKISEAINTYGIDFTTALQSFFKGDSSVLDEFEINEGDINEELRRYLGNNGPGNSLMKIKNLDDYLFSGESTRSSFGIIYIDLLRNYRDLKKSFRELFILELENELKLKWSSIESQIGRLDIALSKNIEAHYLAPMKVTISEFKDWINDMSSNALVQLKNAISTADLEKKKELKDIAKNDIDLKLNRLLASLRQMKREFSLTAP